MRTEQPTKSFDRTTSETEGDVVPEKAILGPRVINYSPCQSGSSVVVLCCMFLMSVSVTFHFIRICTDYFCSVPVAESPLFGKELLTQSAVCSLCKMSICTFSFFILLYRFLLITYL